MSLAWRLAILTTALLIAGVGTLLFGTRRALYESARARARARMLGTVRELAALAEAANGPRHARLLSLSHLPEFRAAVGAGRDSAGLAEQLASVKVDAPDTSTVELWDASGRPLVRVGDPIPDDRPPIPPGITPESVWVSPVEYDARGTHVWWILPVTDAAPVPTEAAPRVVGYMAARRRIMGTRSTGRQLANLAGDTVHVRLRNLDNTGWSEVWGEPLRPPLRRDTIPDGLIHSYPGGVRLLAEEARVRRTPYVIVIELSEAGVLDAPARTMRALAVFGVLIVLAGALLAYVFGRRLTRPLAALTDASEEVARGTYEHAVVRVGGDEIGRLAGSFDAMARQVVLARRELEQRAADAQALATRLTEANNRLTTAMHEAEEARRVAEAASRAKSDFLAVMSHELRTPLNAIGGYAELLEMEVRGPLSAQQREDLQRIRRSQRHLLALIEDVLGFAQLDAGKVRFALRDVALEEALADVESHVVPQAHARGVSVERAALPEGIVLHADVDKLRQVVLNLLANAIKFTPSGGRVTLAAEVEGERVHIHVRDTGPGIPADRIERIFEPFVQGDRALNRPGEGVGLGLAISRDLARGMGGTLAVASVEGEGATFTLTLTRVGRGPVPTPAFGTLATAGPALPPR